MDKKIDFKNGLILPQRLLNNKYFLKWLGTKEASVWMGLCSKIIRKKNRYSLPNKVFNDFYIKGKLATGWRLEALSSNLGYEKDNKSNLSRYIKSLVNKKVIKKHYVMWNKKRTIVYELGYIKNNREQLYAFEYFTKINAKEELKKLEVGYS